MSLRTILRTLLFSDVGALIAIGRSRPLEASDAPKPDRHVLPHGTPSAMLDVPTDRFGAYIIQQFWATGWPARKLLGLVCGRVILALATPFLLHAVLTSITSLNTTMGFPTSLLVLAVLLGVTGMAGALCTQHFYYNALQIYAMIVNAMNTRVVNHTIALRRSARATMNTGDMVNHLSSDSDAVAESAFFIPEFTASALTIIAVLGALFTYLGWAALAALVTLAIISPLTALVARRYRILDHRIMELRDKRVTLMSQILQGIRVVKYHAWERSVGAEVQSVRRNELSTRTSIVRTDAMSTALFISTTTIVAFSGFLAYVWLGGTLDAPVVFTCLALFAMLEEPFGLVSHLLANLQHARVATTRLHAFLGAARRRSDERPLSDPLVPLGCSLESVGVTYPAAAASALHDVTLHVRPGEAIAIVGPVGAGKSTLLRCALGLQHPTRGRAITTGHTGDQRPRTAWVPQEAFIMNATVETNIAFGESATLSEKALSDIVFDCALDVDLASMPSGTATEIGERGVNLSGGQKQRLSLARAAFHQPGLVGLDDPLSAVDVHTEALLVDRLLFGRWKGITRLVVTHRLDHLHRFDRIVFMDRGRAVASGTMDELLEHCQPFRDFIRRDSAEAELAQEPAGVAVAHGSLRSDNEEAGRITDDEDRAIGAVGIDVYRRYLKAMIGNHPVGAPLVLCVLLISVVGITALPMLQTAFLAQWTNDATAMSALAAVSIYGALGAVVLGAWLAERLLWLQRAIIAGRTLHDQALGGVLGATLRFFDSTPMGRILNRFSRDVEGVDDHLAWNVEQSFKSLSQTLGSIVLVLAVVPALVLVIVPVLLLYWKLQRDYRTSAREAKRLESVARSPRYAHYKELVTGLDVVHGFGKERFMFDGFQAILGDYQRAYFCSILLNRWFSIRVPLISGLVGLATSVAIVFLAASGTISAGTAGLVLSYALSFWMSLNWTVRAFSEVESRMTSVERLARYATLPAEPLPNSPVLADHTPWPVRGTIEIRRLSIRYAEHLPWVLRDFSMRVEGGSTAGIVGRTGSGKSTLLQTLFRFVEPQPGAIMIDGVDITTIPLQRLRRSIAIIPQDPTLFIGTVRDNLDRFGESSDDDVWTALRRVRMDAVVAALPGGLRAGVAEGGANFSQGQRQLLCMARAILAEARIIVLDEATASVDVRTDALIQETIRQEFATVTVLVIAHRLETLADADMIVTMHPPQETTAP